MFVAKTDFDLMPYAIPNLQGDSSFLPYADREEKAMLKLLLGYEFYDLFLSGLVALPGSWISTAATAINQQYVYGNDIWKALTVQTGTAPVEGVNWELVEEGNKWLKLKNGVTYDYSEKTYEWVGMTKMFIPYIFSMWLRDTFDTNSGIGVVIAKGENSTVINPGRRIARAYNDFSVIAGSCFARWNSLYGFLSSDESYAEDNIVFNAPETMNIENL